ncbi:hypothetical protein [Mucilaginibacter lacusdianchii]|uniref:hypothetical protein n=1 Tax=Mucilaginibacter lacusdianchii TaxID=2684211 RepID=UPI00131C675C|nr:hypothetical protein [Mucilaginibacter sp. JXJ CY 39]
MLLSVFALNAGALFIHHFTKSNTDPISLEKNAEDGKDTKEDFLDKTEKKIYSCDYHSYLYAPLALVGSVKSHISFYYLNTVQDPPQTVPTPPPLFC